MLVNPTPGTRDQIHEGDDQSYTMLYHALPRPAWRTSLSASGQRQLHATLPVHPFAEHLDCTGQDAKGRTFRIYNRLWEGAWRTLRSRHVLCSTSVRASHRMLCQSELEITRIAKACFDIFCQESYVTWCSEARQPPAN